MYEPCWGARQAGSPGPGWGLPQGSGETAVTTGGGWPANAPRALLSSTPAAQGTCADGLGFCWARGAAQVPSWSSGRSVQAFGSGTESPTSKSHHWPQIGHRGPRVEHTLRSGGGLSEALWVARTPWPPLSPPAVQPQSRGRGPVPAHAPDGVPVPTRHSMVEGRGRAHLGKARGVPLHAQGPTLCLQIDQPTLGMPSREYYLNEGSDRKASQGQPTLDLPLALSRRPFHSGRPPPSLQGPPVARPPVCRSTPAPQLATCVAQARH